jgi:hypothetical protein
MVDAVSTGGTAMTTEPMMDAQKKRNPLCIRWDDEGHRALTDAAWRMRISASELVRRLVAEGLQRMAAEAGTKAG